MDTCDLKNALKLGGEFKQNGHDHGDLFMLIIPYLGSPIGGQFQYRLIERL